MKPCVRQAGTLCGLLLVVLPLRAADPPAKPAAKAVELFPDEVLATGNGIEIRRSHLDEAAASLRASAAAQGRTIAEAQSGEMDKKLLDRLILNRILLQRATAEDRVKAKTVADKAIAEARGRALSEDSFRRQLLAVGFQPAQFEAKVLEQAVAEKVMERELKPTVKISDADAREFFEHGVDGEARELQALVARLGKGSSNTVFYADAKQKLDQTIKGNLARLDRPETVVASHILLQTADKSTRQPFAEARIKEKQDLAQKLAARLRAGEDFAKLAKQYSDDPQVEQTSGEYTVTRETEMPPELRGAFFSLPVNEVSGVITSRYALHIALVREKAPAGKPAFAKVEKDIREYLTNQEVIRQVPAWAEKLKAEYNVKLVPK